VNSPIWWFARFCRRPPGASVERFHAAIPIFRTHSRPRRVAGRGLEPDRCAAPAPEPGSRASRFGAARPGPEPGRPAEAAKGEKKAESSDEDEKNVYRHTKIVATVGNLLHLTTEQTARLFEIINFLIIVLAVGIPLVRFMPRLFRKRSEALREKIESARKVTEDANTRLSAVEAKLAALDTEIAAYRADVERELVQDEQRIKGSIEEERTRIVASAEQEIASAAAQATRTLRSFAADLAIEQAAKRIALTPDTDRALIAEL